jgi:hypothetical protein
MNPTNEQHLEMLDVLKRAHAWIDSMMVSGMAENTIVTAVHTALVERALRAGGVLKTVEWLQGQADMTHKFGPLMLAEIEKQGR